MFGTKKEETLTPMASAENYRALDPSVKRVRMICDHGGKKQGEIIENDRAGWLVKMGVAVPVSDTTNDKDINDGESSL